MCFVWHASECSAVVWIAWKPPLGRDSTATLGRHYSLTCDTIHWGTECNVDAYYIYRENQLKSTNNTLTFTPLKLSDVGFYVCTATVNRYNFTSDPTFIYLSTKSKFMYNICEGWMLQEVVVFLRTVPPPSMDISSSLGNPIPQGSFPTLTCTIRLDPSIDREVMVSVSWNGPDDGLGELSVTDPLLNGSAEVPTYTSTASLRTVFCESRQYSCSAVVSPLSNSEFIQNGSATSQNITGCSKVHAW